LTSIKRYSSRDTAFHSSISYAPPISHLFRCPLNLFLPRFFLLHLTHPTSTSALRIEVLRSLMKTPAAGCLLLIFGLFITNLNTSVRPHFQRGKVSSWIHRDLLSRQEGSCPNFIAEFPFKGVCIRGGHCAWENDPKGKMSKMEETFKEQRLLRKAWRILVMANTDCCLKRIRGITL
jgi:hypothetical protein